MNSNLKRHTKGLKPISLANQASDYIKNYIAEHQLRPNDKLPSEGEFAEMLNINRLTVRMALQQLNTIGLIETRVGDGSYVRDFSFVPYLREIYDIYFTTVNMNEIYTLRRLIEMESAKELIKKGPTDEELQELKKNLDEYLALQNVYMNNIEDKENFNRFVEKDLDLHYQICLYSGNSLFKDLFELMRPLIRQHISKTAWDRTLTPPPELIGQEDLHIQLYKCLVARDWRTCKRIYPKLIGLV